VAGRAVARLVMHRMLNTIYVTAEAAWLRRDGADLVVEVEGAKTGRVPLHMLEGVVSFGRPGCSPALMAACAEAGIALSHLEPNGRFLARVEGARSGAVLLRRAQHRVADDEARHVPIVRGIVAGKAANQRQMLLRTLRDHFATMEPAMRATLEDAERRMGHAARRTLIGPDVEGLRGIEGEVASLYFGVFDHLIRSRDPDLRFGGRSRRPPLDRVNALLSFLYAMLGHDCRSRWRPTVWTRKLASCTQTGPAGPVSRST
jgi:CRISPR-associated protein Cas1